MPRPVQSADPDHASSLRCLVARVLGSCSEASDTGFVFLIVGPAVARLERDSALSGQLGPLCVFHRENARHVAHRGLRIPRSPCPPELPECRSWEAPGKPVAAI